MHIKDPSALVGYVETSSRALELAGKLLSKQAAAEQQLKAATDGIVSKLSQLQLIDAGQEKLAAAELSQHPNALAVLGTVLERFSKLAAEKAQLQKKAQEQALELGSPVARSNSKRASKSETSDEIFLRRMLGV